ncbi:helix-turn-helix domain-containing protein [Allisonella histaminiformans]
MAARTIHQACTGYKGGAPRFTKEEARKSGRIWLVTRRAWSHVWP